MDEEKKQLAGNAFLDFTILFYTMTKCMYRHENQIRAHSLAFQALLDLNRLPPDKPSMTMSELAEDLKITKQQLTKLVNDLEEKNLAARFHDRTNRRLVNVSITPEGQALLRQLKSDMLRTTFQAFSDLSPSEVELLGNALSSINPLITKMLRTVGDSSWPPDTGSGDFVPDLLSDSGMH